MITFQFVLNIFCNRNSLRAGSSLKSMFVLITLGTNDGLDCPLTTASRSIVTRFIFFTHFCDCTVKAELIYRNNCAKNSFNRLKVGAIVCRQFCTTFALSTSWLGRLGVRFLQMLTSFSPPSCPIHLVDYLH